MNSFKRVYALTSRSIELEFAVSVFEERGKPEYPEKNLHPITFRPPMQQDLSSLHLFFQNRDPEVAFFTGK